MKLKYRAEMIEAICRSLGDKPKPGLPNTLHKKALLGVYAKLIGSEEMHYSMGFKSVEHLRDLILDELKVNREEEDTKTPFPRDVLELIVKEMESAR